MIRWLRRLAGKCMHCAARRTKIERGHESHPGLCCDCFDLSCGMPLEMINDERAARKLGPLKSWRNP